MKPLTQQIVSHFGGQDNVPDDVYNALSTYEKSQDDLSDEQYKLLDSLKQVSASGNIQPKLPELPPVPADTQSDYSFVGFANPTTLPKAQKAASQLMAEQEQGYIPKALAYASGEAQEDPNALGQFIKGNVTGVQRMVDRPIETAATVGSAFLPASWPSVLYGGVLTGTGTALDALHGEDITSRDAYTSAALGGLGTGIGTIVGKVGNKIATPVIDALKKYEMLSEGRAVKAALAERQNANNALELNSIRDAVAQRTNQLGGALTDAEQFASTMPGFGAKEVIAAHKAIGESEEIAQRESLEAIKNWIMAKYPERYAEFAEAFKMSDKEALDYFLNLQKKIPIPEEIAMPNMSKKISDLASYLPYGGTLGHIRYGVEKLPEWAAIPSGLVEGVGKAIANPKAKLAILPVKALESKVRSSSQKK